MLVTACRTCFRSAPSCHLLCWGDIGDPSTVPSIPHKGRQCLAFKFHEYFFIFQNCLLYWRLSFPVFLFIYLLMIAFAVLEYLHLWIFVFLGDFANNGLPQMRQKLETRSKSQQISAESKEVSGKRRTLHIHLEKLYSLPLLLPSVVTG